MDMISWTMTACLTAPKSIINDIYYDVLICLAIVGMLALSDIIVPAFSGWNSFCCFTYWYYPWECPPLWQTPSQWSQVFCSHYPSILTVFMKPTLKGLNTNTLPISLYTLALASSKSSSFFTNSFSWDCSISFYLPKVIDKHTLN